VKSRHALRSDAARIFTAALRGVDPESAVRRTVRLDGDHLVAGRRRFDLSAIRDIWVMGAGKAAASMGSAVERILGPRVSGGILVTKHGHRMPLKMLELLEAGHPLPDDESVEAGSRIRQFAEKKVRPEDLVLCLFSGGASSLLVSPATGISLHDKRECARLLIQSRADIRELNAVRKHLSDIKSGGLARLLAPAQVVSLILSDVVGDDPGTIASGPMSPDSTTFSDCIGILRKYRLWKRVPLTVRRRFEHGAAGGIAETPKMGDPVFEKTSTYIIGSNAHACTAAATTARRFGYDTMVLTSRLEGDNGEAARFHMSVAREIVSRRRPLRRPACLISGGETTIEVTGKGKGGRNQEFVLRCVRELADIRMPCLVVSLGTDGTDGPTDAAGAIADNRTLDRSMCHGADFLEKMLGDNNSYEFFRRLGDLVITGPTRTNVMDVHIVMVG
jgi:glycerate 2-kinase